MEIEIRKKISDTLKRKGIEPKIKFIGKGKYNPMFGKKHTEEAKLKNKLAHLGRHNFKYNMFNNCLTCKKSFRVAKWNNNQIFCSRQCVGLYNRERYIGKNNPCWKGGISNPRRYLRTTKEYYEWRAAVFKKDNYICQMCRIRGELKNDPLQVDHIKQFAYYPELRFNIKNGQVLHKNCHRKTESWGRRLSGNV